MTIKSIKSVARSNKTENKDIIYDIIDDNKVINQKSLAKKNQAKMAKSKNLVRHKNHDFSFSSKNMGTGLSFLTPKAKLAFPKLR